MVSGYAFYVAPEPRMQGRRVQVVWGASLVSGNARQEEAAHGSTHAIPLSLQEVFFNEYVLSPVRNPQRS